MKITDIRVADLPITSPGANSIVDFAGLVTAAVCVVSDRVEDGDPIVGYGFSSIGRWSPAGLLRDRIAPRLMAAATPLDEDGRLDPVACWSVVMANEKPGGHGDRAHAVGALDMALWDLRAKVEGRPLCRVLSDLYGSGCVDDEVAVYAAGGYYVAGDPIEAVRRELSAYREAGYDEVKIKIGGLPLAHDMARIEAAIEVMGGGDRVAVDANGRFDRPTALAYGKALLPLGLRWLEEPGDPLDYDLLSMLTAVYDGPIATGENVFSHQDARNLLRYGGLRSDRDILQMDCGLAYGLPDYRRTLATMCDMGWSLRSMHPHGGHQMSLHLAAGLGLGGNESYPGVFQPLGGFADDVSVREGRVRLPDVPGVGLETKVVLLDWLRAAFR